MFQHIELENTNCANDKLLNSNIRFLYIWIAPSSANCVIPFKNCFLFMVSLADTLAKCSEGRMVCRGIQARSVNSIHPLSGKYRDRKDQQYHRDKLFLLLLFPEPEIAVVGLSEPACLNHCGLPAYPFQRHLSIYA